MKIAISGASGFLGTNLTKMFTEMNIEVVTLGRNIFKAEMHNSLKDNISNCEVVINLAGAPINHRWTKAYKKELYDSRIGTTNKLVDIINSLEIKPKLFISASAVGYYSSDGCFNEYNSKPGKGFLSKLCIEWEKESQKISPEVRLANTRFGIVLSDNGGAYKQMISPAKFGIATIIGNGEQAFSWIDIEDFKRAICFIINDINLKGIINLTSPQSINNKSFTKLIAKHYRSFILIKIPKIFLKILMGESSQFITESICARPTKLLEAGFIFRTNTLEEFITRKTQ